MKHRFTLCFLLLFSLPVLAQRDFRPGFVVRASGDTLRGLVNFRESRAQNLRCIFKPTPTDPVQEFTPETALSYGFTGDRIYEAIALPRDSVTVSRRVFARVLVRGRADLFEMDGQFFARKGGELFALTRSIKEVYVGNSWYKAEVRDYEQLLTAYILADCPHIRLSGDGGVALTAVALTRLFEVYNRCTNSAVIIEANKPRTLWGCSVYGGIGAAGFDLFRTRSETTTQMVSGITPTLGFQINLSSPRRSERFSGHLGLFRTAALFTGSLEIPNRTGMFRSDYYLKRTSLQVPILSRYSFPRSKLSPFAQAGVSVGFHSTRSAWYQAELSEQNQVITERGALPGFASPSLGAILGAGLHTNLTRYLRFTAEVRAELGLSRALDYKDLHSGEKAVSCVSFLVGLGLR